MCKNYNLNGCWIINVPAPKYRGYSFAVYIGEYDASEDEVLSLSAVRDLFEDETDAFYANAEKMTDDDYDFWEDEIVDISE